MRFETPSAASPEEKPRQKKPVKNRFGKMLAAAAVLHVVPFVPQIMDRFKSVEDEWSQENLVLHPQTKEEEIAVQKKIQEREARIDPKKVLQLKETYREKMERGESVTLREEYFDLERVMGVSEDVVKQAEDRADSLIQKYSQEANGDLQDPLIKRMVTEMYGPEEAYVDGQASVSEFFVNGSRNCIAIAKGELIVFEGVILKLPENVQKRYRLGLRKIQQHEIATLGLPAQTYLLEPPISIEKQDADLSGTANVSLDFLKKSLVSGKASSVNAESGGDVQSGPRLDVLSNQPVDDGIVVQGKLRGSGYVKMMAEKRGIKPQKEDDQWEMPIEEEPKKTMESEYLNNVDYEVEAGNLKYHEGGQPPPPPENLVLRTEWDEKTNKYKHLPIADFKKWLTDNVASKVGADPQFGVILLYRELTEEEAEELAIQRVSRLYLPSDPEIYFSEDQKAAREALWQGNVQTLIMFKPEEEKNLKHLVQYLGVGNFFPDMEHLKKETLTALASELDPLIDEWQKLVDVLKNSKKAEDRKDAELRKVVLKRLEQIRGFAHSLVTAPDEAERDGMKATWREYLEEDRRSWLIEQHSSP
jgi:hypothetical protein